MAIFLLTGKQKGSPEGTAPNERRTDKSKCSLPFRLPWGSGGSQIGTTHFKGGEADNLEMTDQTICEYVVLTILTLQSD